MKKGKRTECSLAPPIGIETLVALLEVLKAMLKNREEEYGK